MRSRMIDMNQALFVIAILVFIANVLSNAIVCVLINTTNVMNLWDHDDIAIIQVVAPSLVCVPA